MPETLEEVLADVRGELPVLRKNRATMPPDRVEEFLTRLEEATEEFRLFISEADAALRSGHSADWLRARFPQWERQGHAKMIRGKRHYRTLIVPPRAKTARAYDAGRAAARQRGTEVEEPTRG